MTKDWWSDVVVNPMEKIVHDTKEEKMLSAPEICVVHKFGKLYQTLLEYMNAYPDVFGNEKKNLCDSEPEMVVKSIHVNENISSWVDVEMPKDVAAKIEMGENPEDVLPDCDWYSMMEGAITDTMENGKMSSGFEDFGHTYEIDRWN